MAAPVAVVPQPVAVQTPSVEKPVVYPASARRFWKVVSTKNLIGTTMFLVGTAFLVGYLVSDKLHGMDRFSLGLGFLLMLLGAHLMSSDPTERALKSIANVARPLIPWGRKAATEETQAKQGD